MAKIVINTCYGGFGVSTDAMKLLIQRNSPALVDSADVVEYFGSSNMRLKDEFGDIGDGFYANSYNTVLYNDRVYNFPYDDTYRADPVLVEVVEELGDAANGPYAQLRVVEIPDDVEWEIVEYDGMEHVAEKHRTWYN